jgi:hypothetical protein
MEIILETSVPTSKETRDVCISMDNRLVQWNLILRAKDGTREAEFTYSQKIL